VVPGTGADLLAETLAGDGPADQALDLWSAVADALIHPPTPPTIPKGGEHLHDWLRPWMPRFLGILYAATANGAPAALDAITEQLLDEYQHRLPPGDPGLFAGLAAAAIRNTLADLAGHGAVIVTGASHQLEPHQAAAAAAASLTVAGVIAIRAADDTGHDESEPARGPHSGRPTDGSRQPDQPTRPDRRAPDNRTAMPVGRMPTPPSQRLPRSWPRDRELTAGVCHQLVHGSSVICREVHRSVDHPRRTSVHEADVSRLNVAHHLIKQAAWRVGPHSRILTGGLGAPMNSMIDEHGRPANTAVAVWHLL
jgi:hypothetical protein